MTVSSADLLYDPQVWCYFAILGWSLRGQVRRATRRGLAAACALVGITWFYIFRFTLAYKNGGGANLFDDAYADVLRGPHARSSCQLLTWVVVAFTLAPSRDVLWTGMLGAMSAAYSLSPPDLAPPARVATLDAACALASLACVASLPRLLDAPAAFGAVLKALHALLASIFVDLVACAALSVAAVRRRRWPGVAAAFAAASLVLSPGGALALYLALESAAAAAAPRERTAARFGRVLVVGAGASGLAQGSKRVGAGETAFDVAHGAASAGARAVTMSTRRGFVSVPASFGEGVAPLDCIIANAGTHCWESAWARRVGLHWWITTKFQRLGMLILGGSSTGWNQWVGASVHMDWTEGRKHIVNKATKCMPLLNRSAKGPAWNPYRFWDSAASHVAVGVDLLDKYEPVKFERDGVAFRSLDGGPDRVVEADVVVFATGYRQKFPFLFGAGAGDDPLPGRHFLIDDASRTSPSSASRPTPATPRTPRRAAPPPPDEPSDDDDFDEAAALRAAKRLKVSQLRGAPRRRRRLEDGLKADLVARLVGVRKRAHAADVGARKRARA
ncbi:N,N-dimethylaniline monooxygenase [Aureococcus anophagefferens]|nr:N,N-dimethylaniline monooxygenase [Aureococcus anophagefferens]